jgi:hypothetical protein
MVDNRHIDNYVYLTATGVNQDQLLSQSNPFKDVSKAILDHKQEKCDDLNYSLEDFERTIGGLNNT